MCMEIVRKEGHRNEEGITVMAKHKMDRMRENWLARGRAGGGGGGSFESLFRSCPLSGLP